ncbi:maleylpyruvate isomerase family mycothiol-dependent enzyme [Streptomyces sp. N2-109]|uniref:Maleylpyruvate isomerase family mycothiol-dependent enzyme n=1 Tax=Streptomyces gossypii TaxID=2883101 RepID=A0ABT2JXV0_9ACTN|nr:maleylpyruvate isomerase family mycothiol-dependent enzyme [Streptomyces gossypii]MCT2592541.1 maleylpyruvate isomerase family mycothiol-dependent enzyme [Streptomyces gossypii]
MTPLSHDRCCDELVTQAGQLTSSVAGVDLSAPVPSCPGWDFDRLLRHVGGAYRWIETMVRTRSPRPLTEGDVDSGSEPSGGDAAVLGAWLMENAGQLADTLRSAGPDAEVWTVIPGRTAVFWARRMLHETVLHRADASLALGTGFVLSQEIAQDGFEEWLEFGSLPGLLESESVLPELLGPGRTLHFHATDAASGQAADWLVDLTGDTPGWRHAREDAAVTVRGPLSGLLLLVYGRQGAGDVGPAGADRVELSGDTKLFATWSERVGHWQRR